MLKRSKQLLGNSVGWDKGLDQRERQEREDRAQLLREAKEKLELIDREIAKCH